MKEYNLSIILEITYRIQIIILVKRSSYDITIHTFILHDGLISITTQNHYDQRTVRNSF